MPIPNSTFIQNDHPIDDNAPPLPPINVTIHHQVHHHQLDHPFFVFSMTLYFILRVWTMWNNVNNVNNNPVHLVNYHSNETSIQRRIKQRYPCVIGTVFVVVTVTSWTTRWSTVVVVAVVMPSTSTTISTAKQHSHYNDGCKHQHSTYNEYDLYFSK